MIADHDREAVGLWHEQQRSVAALGASLDRSSETRRGRFVHLMHRMVKREPGEGATSRFRMLPLHLAMEGFLALHFNGPEGCLTWTISTFSLASFR